VWGEVGEKGHFRALHSLSKVPDMIPASTPLGSPPVVVLAEAQQALKESEAAHP
jgi:hypothetical protein